jgi:branched-chain amino acid transport system ATP-binding protein
MARILAKKHSSNQKNMIKLRQRLDFCREEIASLDEKYNEIIERKLNAFLVKGNKSLAKLAFEACDKKEYAQNVLESKLQKYDVKAYMKQRKINHGAAKKIFKKARSGEPFGYILVDRDKQMRALDKKREKYIRSLEKDMERFLAKKYPTYVVPYRRKRAALENEYYAFKASLEEKYYEKLQAEKSKLQDKLIKDERKLTKLKHKIKAEHKLPKDVLLEVKNLKMYFGGLKAVDDLSFTVKKGEIFGLIGPNGAGKTTVFNCITRFYDATDGEMYFENKYGEVVDLRNFKVHDIILQGIGRTFQNIELVKEISVMENLLVASTRSYKTGILGHVLGLPSLKKEEKMLRAKARKILEFMELQNYAEWFAMGLPYGILKKVEIARALMADAKLIIMDEPAAGLNDSETAELTETIRRIRDEFGVTILLVGHDMGLVMNVCDTVCAISFGKMLGIGTTEEIQKNKAVQEAYLGVEED